MTSFADYTTRKSAHQPTATTMPQSSPANTSPSSPGRFVQRLGALLRWVRRFALAVIAFVLDGSGEEIVGDACLRCSSSAPDVRAFILNAQAIDGPRWRIEHRKEPRKPALPSQPGAIVIHADGEDCPRVRIAECDVDLVTVELDAITDGCPHNPAHFVSSKRPKPRSYRGTAPDAVEDMTVT